jgi:hypothetical protein
MALFRVRLLKGGLWEGNYTEIEGNSAKDVAEQRYGAKLSKKKKSYKLRAIVRRARTIRGSPINFFEP